MPIRLRVSREVEDFPDEVSSVDISGIFRSPPTISYPSEKRIRWSIRLLRNVSCRSLGAYRFARVSFLSPVKPFRYRK